MIQFKISVIFHFLKGIFLIIVISFAIYGFLMVFFFGVGRLQLGKADIQVYNSVHIM